MGIALLSFADLLMPLQSLASRWIPAHQRRSRPTAKPDSPARPLRVVRMVDARQPAMLQGRMVISGRMSDVCAELDRLAALEAAEQLH